MLSLENINKSYGSLQVLRDVSLEILPNEIITIVGPSGAGKTTLLQIAGTLDRPDSGKVLYDGDDLSQFKDKKLSQYRNNNIGFIFQFHQLLPEFTAAENVAIPAMIAGESRKQSITRALELLSRLGLADRADHKPAQLSGGERQRVAIARALINKPKVIFADEPTGSLDSRNRDEICDLITRLRDELGHTFVIVTHDPTISRIADRIVHMADGRITMIEPTRVESDPAEESDSDQQSTDSANPLPEAECEINPSAIA